MKKFHFYDLKTLCITLLGCAVLSFSKANAADDHAPTTPSAGHGGAPHHPDLADLLRSYALNTTPDITSDIIYDEDELEAEPTMDLYNAELQEAEAIKDQAKAAIRHEIEACLYSPHPNYQVIQHAMEETKQAFMARMTGSPRQNCQILDNWIAEVMQEMWLGPQRR